MKCIACYADAELDHSFEARNPGTGEMETIETFKCANGHFFSANDPQAVIQNPPPTDYVPSPYAPESENG